jgi:predicted amidohydrolase
VLGPRPPLVVPYRRLLAIAGAVVALHLASIAAAFAVGAWWWGHAHSHHAAEATAVVSGHGHVLCEAGAYEPGGGHRCVVLPGSGPILGVTPAPGRGLTYWPPSLDAKERDTWLCRAAEPGYLSCE